MKEELSPRGRALALLAAVAVLAVVVLAWPGLLDLVADLSTRLERVLSGAGAWGVVAFVALAFVSALLSPFSSLPVVPAAVLAWGRWGAFALLLAGWMLGDLVSWTLGRYAAHPLVRRILPWQKLERLKERVPKEKALLLAALLRIALPSEIGYAYGALRFPLLLYLAITFLAELPVAAIVIWGGEAVLEGRAFMVAAIVVLAAVLAAAAWVAKDLLEEARKEA